MEQVRAMKVEKYMVFTVNGSLFNNGFSLPVEFDPYLIGVDLSREANIFCGIKEGNEKYNLVFNIENFDDYDAIFRVLNWSKHDDLEEYTIRVLKSNRNEKVDFEEETEYLKSFIRIV